MTRPKKIRSSIIPGLQTIHLYPETIQHVKQQHPEIPAELPCIVTAVENAVTNPTHVEISYSNSHVFVDAGTTNGSGDPLRVPVKSVTTDSGRVKSFYFASSEKSERIIWRRSDD